MAIGDEERKLYSALLEAPGTITNSFAEPFRINDRHILDDASYIVQKGTGNKKFKWDNIDEIPGSILDGALDKIKTISEIDIYIVDGIQNQRAREMALRKDADRFMTLEDYKLTHPNSYEKCRSLGWLK
jgi:hypothetical protein